MDEEACYWTDEANRINTMASVAESLGLLYSTDLKPKRKRYTVADDARDLEYLVRRHGFKEVSNCQFGLYCQSCEHSHKPPIRMFYSARLRLMLCGCKILRHFPR